MARGSSGRSRAISRGRPIPAGLGRGVDPAIVRRAAETGRSIEEVQQEIQSVKEQTGVRGTQTAINILRQSETREAQTTPTEEETGGLIREEPREPTRFQKIREAVISSLSPSVLRLFKQKATPEEKEELLRGTRIAQVTVGSKGTVLTRFKKEETPEGTTERIALVKHIEPKEEIVFPPEIPKQEYKLPPGVEPTFFGKLIFGIRTKYLSPIVQPRATIAQEAFRTELKEHPIKTGALFAGGLALGPAEFAISKIPLVGPRLLFLGRGALAIGTGAYAYFRGKAVYMAPTFKERYTEVGKTLAEVTPVGFGTILGKEATRGGLGLIRTFGRKEIPAEQLIPKSVLEGKVIFPEAPIQKQLKIFKTQARRLPGELEKTPKVFHAAPDTFKKEVTIKTPFKLRKHDVPALYVAPFISPHFFRTGEKLLGFPTRIPTTTGFEPTALRIYPKRIIEAPTGTIAQKRKYFETKAPKGYAIIPKIKTEIEAGIPPKTKLQLVGKEFFLKYERTRIPIQRYKAISDVQYKKLSFGAKKKVKTFERLSRESRVSRQPIIYPSPRIFSRASYPSYSKISPRISSSISKISRPYKPTSRITSIISSKVSAPSSRIITRAPSYVTAVSRISRITTPRTSRRITSFIRTLPPIIKLPKFQLKKGFIPYKLPSQVTKYTPSIVSLEIGKFVKKLPKKKLITGLEIRPILK